MLITTEAFKNKVWASQRQLQPLLEIDFRPGEAVFVVEAKASSILNNDSRADNVTQMLLSPHTWSGTGAYVFNVKKNYGWRSLGESDVEGNVNEWVQVTYSKAFFFKSIFMVSFKGYQPENFNIEARINGIWLKVHTEVNNHEQLWSVELPVGIMADGLRMNVTKIPTSGNNVRVLTFGFPHKLVLSQDDIEDYKVLEESSGESSSPLGSVTSNELSINLKNNHKWFTPANASSPFGPYLKPGVRMKIYIGLATVQDACEVMPLGTFYTTDWETPIESLTASLTGLDRVNVLNQQTPTKVPILHNTTIRKLFEIFFRSYGLLPTEYTIDMSLNQKVPIGWIPPGNFIEAAQVLSEAGNCSVIVTRNDKIAVKNNFVKGDPLDVLTDDNAITSISNPMSFLKTYNVVKVKYKIPTLSQNRDLLSIEGAVFPPGVTVMRDLEFKTGPVDKVLNVQLAAPNGALKVKSLKYGAWYVDIEIENTSWESVTSDMVLVGTTIELITTEFTSAQKGVTSTSVRTFEVDNELIQDATVAKIYAISLRAVLEDPSLIYKASTRGNPSHELFDLISVQSDSDGIVATSIVPTRLEITYDGGFDILIEGKKPIVPKQTVFMNANFWFELDMPIMENYY